MIITIIIIIIISSSNSSSSINELADEALPHGRTKLLLGGFRVGLATGRLGAARHRGHNTTNIYVYIYIYIYIYIERERER